MSSQMLYHNLNDEQMQTLRHDEKNFGSQRYICRRANTQIENYLVIPLSISSKNNSQIVMDEIVEGQYPHRLYDVAVDKALFGATGASGGVSQSCFYDGNTENFTVVGLTDSGSTERVYSFSVPNNIQKREAIPAFCWLLNFLMRQMSKQAS